MARKNRIVVEDGLYHLTTRIAHQERLLADPKIKSLIVDWIYGIADFAGIDVYSWNVMDNHLHLYVHVPPVPAKYHTSPEGTVPLASAFSMRPAENRAPRWSPDIVDRNHPITPAGDCPSEEAIMCAIAVGVPVAHVPHPPTSFTMSDEEMLSRVRRLYYPNAKAAENIAERWAAYRTTGADDRVEEEKEAFCRRMYNVSQYMKALKQRITEYFNRKLGHEGQLWDGRFYSGLVDRDELASLYVASYIELNSFRTKRKIAPKDWAWCSYSTALGDGKYRDRAREGYEKMMGVAWQEVVKQLESIFAVELPEDYDPKKGKAKKPLTMAQLVKVPCRVFDRGGFISRDPDFAKRTLSAFAPKFPAMGDGSIRFFMRRDWALAA